MSRQGLAQNDQNAIFGQSCVVLGQKILIFTGESKIFGTHITEKPPRQRVRIVFGFGQALDQMGQICRYLAKNASFGPNSNFGPKFRFLPNDTKFCQRFVCSPRRDSPFRTLASIFRLFFFELLHFSVAWMVKYR